MQRAAAMGVACARLLSDKRRVHLAAQTQESLNMNIKRVRNQMLCRGLVHFVVDCVLAAHSAVSQGDRDCTCMETRNSTLKIKIRSRDPSSNDGRHNRRAQSTVDTIDVPPSWISSPCCRLGYLHLVAYLLIGLFVLYFTIRRRIVGRQPQPSK